MRKLNPANLKILGSLFVLVFLFASIVVIVRYLPQQRGSQPKAAAQTFYSQSSDGWVEYDAGFNPPDQVYTCQAITPSNWITVGQAYEVSYGYGVYRGYISFDTSTIPSAATITSATLRLKVNGNNTATDFTLRVGGGSGANWGVGLDCSDWGRLGTLNSTTYNTTSLPAVGSTFNIAIDSALVTRAGTTYLMLRSSREENDTEPAGYEYFDFYSGDSAGNQPQLIVNYTSPAPTVDIKADGSDGPITINYNTSATLSWTSTDATSCTASGSWSGSKGTSDSESVGPLSGPATYTYTLTCGSASDSVTVNVFPTISADFDGEWKTGNTCATSNTTIRVGMDAPATRERFYARFPLSALPSAATITKVELQVANVGSTTGGPTIDIQAYDQNGQADPSADTCSTVGTRTANDTSPYINNQSMGSSSTLTWDLGASAISDIVTAKAAVNRFSIAINTDAMADSASVNTRDLAAIEHTTAAEPKLIITYTLPPTVDIKADGSDGPVSVAYNTAATISWSSSYATSCSVSPTGWIGTSNTGISTGNLTATTIYTLSCTGAGGSASDSVTVNVNAPPPTADIKADGSDGPITITYNTAATISWSSTNATSCSVSPTGWAGLSNTGISTGNLTATTTYTLSCNGAGGSASDSVTVNVARKIGDVDGNGVVNIFDLSILLSRWETNDTAADLNGNGLVDIFDLSILLSHWEG